MVHGSVGMLMVGALEFSDYDLLSLIRSRAILLPDNQQKEIITQPTVLNLFACHIS